MRSARVAVEGAEPGGDRRAVAVPVGNLAADQTRSRPTRPPRVKVASGPVGAIVPDGDRPTFENAISASTGTSDRELSSRLVNQALDASGVRALDGPERANLANALLAQLHALEPDGVLEGMIGVQMVACHGMAMKALALAHAAEDSELRALNGNLAGRLMRAFTGQAEVLAKLKGKGTRQVVRVEHVTVQAGGQAVVGAISGTRGRGDRDERG